MGLTVVSQLGTRLDSGNSPQRWRRWRPSLSVVQGARREIDRYVLWHPPSYLRMAKQVAKDIRQISPHTQVDLHPVDVSNPWDFEQVYEQLLLASEALAHDPDQDDLWVHLTTGTHVSQICLFLLVETGFLPGLLAQTRPPQDELHTVDLIDLNLARYDRLATRFDAVAATDRAVLKGGIETKNLAFNRLIAEIEQVAIRSTAPTLLTGPTGAGKTHLARQIYALKHARRLLKGRLVEVNCATLRGDTAMSALFGHLKGAFTGAAEAREGLLRQADGGLLFLDEVGELGLDEQAMLLRAIEDKTFFPLGADQPVTVDFQLVAGTHHDLRAAVSRGSFRADLLARMDTWTFALPGLAQRPEDIAPNVDVELDRFASRHGRRVHFNHEARAAYLAFATQAPWPGNFRDLSASIERLATLCEAGRITTHDVQREVRRLQPGRATSSQPQDDAVHVVMGPAADTLDRFDRVQLHDVLTVCAQSASLAHAGRTLFAQSRQRRSSRNDSDRLRKYLAKHGLRFDEVRARWGPPPPVADVPSQVP